MEEYSKLEFEKAYYDVFNSVVKEGVPQKKHCVMFLGGQPGSGKSRFYSQDDSLNGYIVIDGDKYRRFHPHHDEIVRYDIENYAERTQPFVNACIEKLISDLSDQGYNLIIEGTLRDPDVPIKTCRMLKEKEYTANLYVICEDACVSWESTVNRANILSKMGEVPRLVPIDKYNQIVNALPDNLRKIEQSDLFDDITLLNRSNEILYDTEEEKSKDFFYQKDLSLSLQNILQKSLNLKKWNNEYDERASAFFDDKINLIYREKHRFAHTMHKKGR